MWRGTRVLWGPVRKGGTKGSKANSRSLGTRTSRSTEAGSLRTPATGFLRNLAALWMLCAALWRCSEEWPSAMLLSCWKSGCLGPEDQVVADVLLDKAVAVMAADHRVGQVHVF